MSQAKRTKPLYQRGKYALYARPGRTNLEIVWYDDVRKRERSSSAGSGDLREARLALDRLYLADEGERLCPTCRRPWDHGQSPYVAQACADYLILKQGTAGYDSSRHRLAHVLEYLATRPDTRCAQVDEAWIAGFRSWAMARPVLSPKGRVLRPRSLAHVEGSIMALAAAIKAISGQAPDFAPKQQVQVARSPSFRADVALLARMFRWCLWPEEKSEKLIALRRRERATLLAYLRLAVATWARPETVLDVQPEQQWHSAARVLDLNPRWRPRTNKRLPMIPIARQLAPWLDGHKGNWINATTTRGFWDRMRTGLGLPGDGQAGPKLIRRSMATLVRRRIGEANWRQGEIMLGHVEFRISDIYAIPDPANLGLALAATEAIIDEIEVLCPGAYRKLTAAEAPASAGRSVVNA